VNKENIRRERGEGVGKTEIKAENSCVRRKMEIRRQKKRK
jgi:hypothetical protein